MKYLCTIYGDESQLGRRYAGADERDAEGLLRVQRGGGEGRRAPGRRGPRADVGGHHRPRPRRRARALRRPIRRDQGAARRLLPARLRQPRRGDRLGREDPRRRHGLGRGEAGHELRGRRQRGRDSNRRRLTASGARRGRRPPVPARVGAGGRGPDPGARRLRPAEDAVQEAFAKAVARWPSEGVPANPAGWITLTARNSAIDRLRRDAATRRSCANSNGSAAATGGSEAETSAIPDDRLRLFFTCCHPALA